MKVFSILILSLFVFSCATSFSNVPNEIQYQEARYNYNCLVEEYNVVFRKADFKSQLKLKTWLEPQISKTGLALFSWKIAIKTSNYYKSMERERQYSLVNSKLLSMIKEL